MVFNDTLVGENLGFQLPSVSVSSSRATDFATCVRPASAECLRHSFIVLIFVLVLLHFLC